MDTIFINSNNSKTLHLHKLLKLLKVENNRLKMSAPI